MTCPRACLRIPGHTGFHTTVPAIAEREDARTKNRFWKKVKIGSPDTCWPWTAGKVTCGYGSFSISHRTVSAHRVAWEMTHGRIPSDLCVLHSCDRPECVNPGHLRLGTHTDNMRDMISRDRNNHVRGEIHPSAKLTEAQAVEIRESPGSHRSIAERYGVAYSTVGRIRRGEYWASAK